MKLILDAACGCNIGKLRTNNEDNFCFDGRCLSIDEPPPAQPLCLQTPVKRGMQFAVLDGMGGEEYGELASWEAAQALLSNSHHLRPPQKHLRQLTLRLNDAVVAAQKIRNTYRMGSTLALLYLTRRHAFVCNAGDSRIYRFRNGSVIQLSVDHVAVRPGREHRKAPLTRFLGLDPEEVILEPSISKFKLVRGDIFLICSDGVTDMLTDQQIAEILHSGADASGCVDALIQASLNQGGRDNITAIVCKLK